MWGPLRVSRPAHRGITEGVACAQGFCLHQPRGALLLLLYCLLVPPVSQEAGSGACQPPPNLRRRCRASPPKLPGTLHRVGDCHTAVFHAAPGTASAPHCACHVQRPPSCAACNSNTPGDSVNGGTAPLTREGCRGGLGHGRWRSQEVCSRAARAPPGVCCRPQALRPSGAMQRTS